jgi:hypothetical protein
MESVRKNFSSIPSALKGTRYIVLAEEAIRTVNANKIKVN